MSERFDEDALLEGARTAAMRALIRGTESVRNEALTLILKTAKTGRIYRRGRRQHQASAPGEAPASDTGTLVNRIRTSYDPDNLVGTITASTAYAAPLEYGTSRMAARPYLRPALANRLDAITADIQREVSAAVAAVLRSE